MQIRDADIVLKHQLNLINNSTGDASEMELGARKNAFLQSRLSGYKTYQEKTQYNQEDLEGYDMQDFYEKVLNDRSPESLVIDDVQRDSKYIRSQVMNLRDYGQRYDTQPFLNEVQLYETTKDPRGTENIPTDRLRADMFLSKVDFYKMNLYPDDLSNMLTESISDFERRDLIFKQQNQARKRTIVFDDERINYLLNGNINKPAARDKIQTVSDQIQEDSRNQVKRKVWQDIHDNRFNYQAIPDHLIQVADYSQVFIKNASLQPLNLLFFSKDEKENFEDNAKDSFSQVLKQLMSGLKPAQKAERHNQQDTMKQLEVLMAVKKQQYIFYDQYCNRAQAVMDQMRDFNITYNYIPKSPQMLNQKCLLELTVIEDFLAIARDSSNRKQMRMPISPQQRQQEYEKIIASLTESYINNLKQTKATLDRLKYNTQGMQDPGNSLYITNSKLNAPVVNYLQRDQESMQDKGDHVIQTNKPQVQQYIKQLLSFFTPDQLQQFTDNQQAVMRSAQRVDAQKQRSKGQAQQHSYMYQQDLKPKTQQLNPVYSTHKKIDRFGLPLSRESGQVSNMAITPIMTEGNLSTTRALPKVNNNLRYSQYSHDPSLEQTSTI